MIKKQFLTEIEYQEDIPLDKIKTNFAEIFKCGKLLEFTEIDNSTYTELGRRRINLRTAKSELKEGDICKLKSIDSPKMIIELIYTTKVHEKAVTLASCVWFGAKSLLCRDAFTINSLEAPTEKSTTVKTFKTNLDFLVENNPHLYRSIKSNERVLSIKNIRELTGLGLKESKDLYETITTNNISNWDNFYRGGTY